MGVHKDSIDPLLADSDRPEVHLYTAIGGTWENFYTGFHAPAWERDKLCFCYEAVN